MRKKFFTHYDLKELKSQLRLMIEVEAEDNFLTHFRQTMLFKNEEMVSGNIKNDSFKLWIHEQGRLGLTGVFYPVVRGKLNPLSQGTEIKINSKMNSIGRAIFLLITAAMAYGVLQSIVIQENNELQYLIPRALMGMLLLGLMCTVPLVIHLKTSGLIKKYLVDELKLSHQR